MREVALKTTLYCRQPPSHDKVYHIQLKQVAGGWLCTSQYGKRGYGMTEANPMEVPAGYAVARAVFMKLYEQKSRKYTEDARGDRLRGSAPIIEEEVGPAPVVEEKARPTLKPKPVKTTKPDPRDQYTADAREVVTGLQRARGNTPGNKPAAPEPARAPGTRRKIDLTLLEDE